MKIGVELRLDRDAGELFADARAFEAADADSFWVFGREDHDAWALLGAIAAAVWRARIVAVEPPDRPNARRTVERLSRGRLLTAKRAGDALALGAEGEPERWTESPLPSGRAAWKELREARTAEGFTGIVVPNDPRLLDLLRNPDVEDDRSDLRQSVG